MEENQERITTEFAENAEKTRRKPGKQGYRETGSRLQVAGYM